MHCEYAEDDKYWNHECDSNPVYCDYNVRNAKFDYDKQVYMLDGKEVTDAPKDWEFPCPKCKSPSKLNRVDAYGEYYTCLNDHEHECGHSFTVK